MTKLSMHRQPKPLERTPAAGKREHPALRRMLVSLPDGSKTDVELYAFGTPVRVATPPSARVIDFEDLDLLR